MWVDISRNGNHTAETLPQNVAQQALVVMVKYHYDVRSIYAFCI